MKIDANQVRLARALADFGADRVRLQPVTVPGATHVVASRNGLFLVKPGHWHLLMHGQFFGMTFDRGDLLVFEACSRPRDPAQTGRVLRIRRKGDTWTGGEVVARGLDNGCHAMDLIDGRLCLVDTYQQRLMTMQPDGTGLAVVQPFETAGDERFMPDDPRYLHANSLLATGEHILVLLHRGWAHTGRDSEIAVLDRDWRPVERYPLSGRGCHDLALMEDGSLLYCDSVGGALAGTGGLRVELGTGMTRGMAVGEDDLVVGSSAWSERSRRMESSGTVTFLDRQYRVTSEIEVPGAPTVIRRLDGKDRGLSAYLASIGAPPLATWLPARQ